MKTRKKSSRRAYALFSVMALIFLLTVLLGVAVIHTEYSFGVMDVSLKRIQARSELVSMTNLALKWLSAEFKKGVRPRATISNTDETLTDFNALSVFSSYSVKDGSEGKSEGKVEVFDLEYPLENVAKKVDDPLFFPPHFPGGYMVRATVIREGLLSLITESVYASVSKDVPGGGVVYTLEEKPVYWKESFR